ESERSVTVPRMPSPRAPGQARRTSKARASARRRTRRIAGLVVLSIALLVTFLLTAFANSGSSQPTQTRPAPANRFLPSGQPRPQVVALRGPLRLQLPIAQDRVTAIGYHSTGGGALSLDPAGGPANEGPPQRVANQPLVGKRPRALVLHARRRERPEHGVSRRRRARRDRRLLARRRHDRRDHPVDPPRRDVRRAHRHPADDRTGARRARHTSPPRSGADR